MTSPYNPEFQFTDWPDGPLNANLPPDPLSPNAVLNQVETEFGNIATAFTELPVAPLIGDTLDVDPAAYRQGDGRPAVSLREAINALLAGHLPATPDIPVPGTRSDQDHCEVLDATGGLVVISQSIETSDPPRLYAARLDLARPGDGFSPAVVFTGSSTFAFSPTAVALPGGELIVAYFVRVGTTHDVVMKRAALAGLPAATVQNVAATVGVDDLHPCAVLAGNRVVFLTHNASSSQWTYRRYDHAASTFVDTAPVALSPGSGHAAAAGGFVWSASISGTQLHGRRLNAADGTVTGPTSPLDVGNASGPLVLAVSDLEAMVLLDTGTELRTVNMTTTGWGPLTVIPGTVPGDSQPTAVRDADGVVYLFHARLVVPGQIEIILRRRSPITGQWSLPQRIRHTAADTQPSPVFVPGQGVWLVYLSNRTGNFDLYATRVLTAI